MAIKTKIKNEQEFVKAIDQYGDVLARISALNDDAAMLRTLLEAHANAAMVTRRETERYQFWMKTGSSALRTQPGVTKDDVIALLRKAGLAQYLTTGYDTKALKEDLGESAAGRERLAALGLTLTEAARHAEVKAINSKTRKSKRED